MLLSSSRVFKCACMICFLYEVTSLGTVPQQRTDFSCFRFPLSVMSICVLFDEFVFLESFWFLAIGEMTVPRAKAIQSTPQFTIVFLCYTLLLFPSGAVCVDTSLRLRRRFTFCMPEDGRYTHLTIYMYP